MKFREDLRQAIIKLTDGQIKAYHDTVALLVEAATISYEDHTKPLILFTDASDSHLGPVLEQEGRNATACVFFKEAPYI